MSLEVYLVVGEAGQWDSYHTWNVAAYTVREDAEQHAVRCQVYGDWLNTIIQVYDGDLRDADLDNPELVFQRYAEIIQGPSDTTGIWERRSWLYALLPTAAAHQLWRQEELDTGWMYNPYDPKMSHHEQHINYQIEVLPLDPVLKEPA